MATLTARRSRLLLAWALALLPGLAAAIILRSPLTALALLPALAAFILRAAAEKVKTLRLAALACLGAALFLLLANSEARAAFATSGLSRVILILQAFVFTLLSLASPLPRFLAQASILALVEIIFAAASESIWLFPLTATFFTLFAFFWLQIEAAVFPAPFALQNQISSPASASRRRFGAPRYSRRNAALLVIAMLLGGALLFAAAPRFAAVGWHRLFTPPGAERDDEGGIRELEMGLDMDMRGPFAVNLSAEEVMRVRLTDPDGNNLPDWEELRVRGWIYDVYHLGVWLRSSEFHEINDADDGNRDGWVSVAPAENSEKRLIQQTIEPRIMQPAIFGIPRICFVQAPALRRDAHGNLAPPANAAPLRYTVLSDATASESVSELPPRLAAIYRALPPAFHPAAAIARAIIKPEDDAKVACERFAAYLRDNFEYTLESIGKSDEDPLANFLAQRRGICMHFATAMVAMARAIGLPARIVGGYYTTEKEGEGNLFVVRRMHAHAWAEVWLDKRWQAIDATPAGALRSDETLDIPQSMPLFTALEGWLRQIALYGQDERRLLLAALWHPKLLLALLVCVLTSVWLWRCGRRYAVPAARKKAKERQANLAFFNRYLRALGKRGVQRRANETVFELAQRVNDILPKDAVQTITSLFEKIKYGGAALDASEKKMLQAALRRIETAPGHKR